MSGMTINNNPRALFDRLLHEDSSAFVLKDGEIQSSGSMAFRSGLRRMFGVEKSNEDIQANKATLQFLLDHISEQVTDEEMVQIMQQKIRLGGEREGYTVAERLERGTFVSSELVGQLRMIAGRVHESWVANEEARREEIHQHNQTSQTQIAIMFGRIEEPRSGDSGAPKFRSGNDRLEMALRPLQSDRPSPFMQVIDDLCTNGTEDHPRGEIGVWRAFRDYWTKGVGANEGDRERLIQEWHRRITLDSMDMANEGKSISKEEIKAKLKEFLTDPKAMAAFVAEVNDSKVRNMSPGTLRDVVQGWVGSQPGGIEPRESEWLLNELEKSDQLARSLDLTPEEMRAGGRILQLIHGSEGGSDNPLLLSARLREAMIQGNDANPSTHELKPDDMAKLLDGTLRQILTENRERIGQRQGGSGLDEKVKEDLAEFYPELSDFATSKSKDVLLWVGRPQTVAEMTKGILSVQIEGLMLERAVKGAKEGGKDITLPDVQNEIAESVKQSIARHREMQEQILPTLDEYVTFRREIDALRQTEGGLRGAPKETLQRLDAQAERFKTIGLRAMDYVDQLKNEFGDDMKAFVELMDSAFLEMTLGASVYDGESGRLDRDHIAGVEKRLGELQPLDRKQQEKLDWMTNRLHDVISPYPGLRNYVESVDPSSNTRLKSCESIDGLLEATVLYPIKMSVRQSILTDNSLSQQDRLIKAREHLLEMDKFWDEKIQPGLVALNSLGSVPSPPEKLDRDSIDKYRQELTEYIGKSNEALGSIQTAGQELHGVGNEVQDKERFFMAGESLILTMGDIGAQIEFARQRLEALG